MKNFHLKILLLSLLFCFTQFVPAQEKAPGSETEKPPAEAAVSEKDVPKETVTTETKKPQEETPEVAVEAPPTETAVTENKGSPDSTTKPAEPAQEEKAEAETGDTLTETAVKEDEVTSDSMTEPAEPAQEEIADADTSDSLAETALSTEETPKDTVTRAASVQDSVTVSGIVTDLETGDTLFGVLVTDSGTSDSTITNKSGFFSLTLPRGTHTIKYSFTGYKPLEKKITVTENVSLSVPLKSTIQTLSKQVIVSERKDHNITSTEMSMEKFDIEDIETVPVIMGEKDIMKTIQLFPGITSVAEGRAAIIVRGGSIDQNQIMMDGMPIYYFSHMNGLYSIFNSEALEDMVVYKGGIPARYGGRAASFLDVTMKEGNNTEFHTSVGVGLIASNFFVESPIVKEKLSFFVAGRSTRLGIGRVIDTILVRNDTTTIDPDDPKQNFQNDPRIFTASGGYFGDLNGKIVYHINDKNSLYLSGYLGKDGESEGTTAAKEWGNNATTLRWNHGFGPKMLSNTSLIYSRYWTNSVSGVYVVESSVRTAGLRQEFSWFPNKKNTMIFGLCSEYLDFNHGTLSSNGEENEGQRSQRKGGKGRDKFMAPMQSIESALFVSNDQKINEKLSAYYGLRYSLFHRVGPGNQVTYDEYNNPRDNLYFHRREIMQFYHNLEPRFSLNFIMNENNSLKFSYNRTAQYTRLMTNSMELQYYDIWMPCTKNIKPLASNQIALGYFRDLADHAVNFSAETYYKKSKGDFDFEDGLDHYFISDLEAFVATGTGRGYGLELMLKKPSGRFTGWLSYNLGRSELKINGINNNEWYDSKFDKTHDVTLVSSFKIFKSLSISATWIYATGNAVTLAEGVYEIGGVPVSYYSGRNEYRIPDYHRLDLGLIYDPLLFKKLFNRINRELKTSMEFSIYNAYNHRNINYIEYETVINKGEQGSSKLIPYGVSRYGIMPSFLIKLIF